MDLSGCSEIVELDARSVEPHSVLPSTLHVKVKPEEHDGKPYDFLVDDDLHRLIKAIDIRTSSRVSGSCQPRLDSMQKNAGKKPAPKFEISESVTLKQALRRLCISQASEMAATKRLSKPIGLSDVSEAGTIKRLYASVVVEASGKQFEEKKKFAELSALPGNAIASVQPASCDAGKVLKIRIQDVVSNSSIESSKHSNSAFGREKKCKAVSKAAVASSQLGVVSTRPPTSSRLIKPVFQNKTCIKKKVKPEPVSVSGATRHRESKSSDSLPSKFEADGRQEPGSPTLSSKKHCTGGSTIGVKTSDFSRSGEKEKGECSHSSKSSIGDYSTSTSISEDSHGGGGSRPHMSKDARWVAIRHVAVQQGGVRLENFKLLQRLGCGDIGTVYLAELIGSECLFALKVMDIEFLISRKKMLRAQTEREILQMLDHPFLPTLYAHFITDNLLCFVMEYCPGGDLHVLRQKQPTRSFSEPASRFFVAEVLLALEYLHMLGVIYRDLKPENILVRIDGHIMLSDFDLSLRCSVSPTLLRSSSLGREETSGRLSGACPQNGCIEPLCLQPSWVQASCFTPRLVSSSAAFKNKKLKSEPGNQVSPLPQLIVEPTDARSNSFVGTHEYLAPEIIRGDGHGSSVDWWTLGIFLYELLFGRTPFKGSENDETLGNVVSQGLKFPDNPSISFHARDLIRGLLEKEPENRLGSARGAAEIKRHPFFDGLNWALIRCAAPPETSSVHDVGTPVVVHKKKEGKCFEFRSNGDNYVEFEIF